MTHLCAEDEMDSPLDSDLMTSALATIGDQLQAARSTVDGLEQAIKAIVDVDPAKFATGYLSSIHDDVGKALRASRERLTVPSFRIGTMATTSAGKSTLVNAMIGRRLAPLSAAEMSAGILRFVHQPFEVSVYISATDGADWPIGHWPEDAEKPNDEQIYNLIRNQIMVKYHDLKRVRRISMPHVTVKAPLLPGAWQRLLGLPDSISFEVVDLPGLNSTNSDDANLALIQQQNADAFRLMVLDYTQTDDNKRDALLKNMTDVVRDMGGRPDAILFVLNKFNLRDAADSDDDISRRIETIQKEIQERLCLAEPPDVVPIDARSWMYAQCAWGPSPLNHLPSAPPHIRQKCLSDFRRDCATEMNDSRIKIRTWKNGGTATPERGLVISQTLISGICWKR